MRSLIERVMTLGDMTKNFSRREFACKCGCGADYIDSLLVETLQVIREDAGVPLIINSGVRCVKHNKKVGGVPNSQHTLGKAADITWGRPVGDLYHRIYHLYKKGKIPHLGYMKLYSEKNFIHLDVRHPKSDLVTRWS